MFINFKYEFTEIVVCMNNDIDDGKELSIVSMSLVTLFNMRPIGVVSNRLIGFLNMRELVNLYNFSPPSIVPNDKVNDDATIEKTRNNAIIIKKQMK